MASPEGSPEASPIASPIALSPVPLWQTAIERGIIYGSSGTTWQVDDAEYKQLFLHEPAILFTEDDLLWWRLKPSPDAELDFQYGDQFVNMAQDNQKLVFGAHLVWDEGFGDGWTEDDIFGLDKQAATDLMLGTIDQEVSRYKGEGQAWSVVNEAIDANEADGMRKDDYPWYQTVGPDYIEQAFNAAHEADPDAILLLNEFGFETDSEYDKAADKQAKTLIVLDKLLAAKIPVHALGVQAHLVADGFANKFDTAGYQKFLSDVADRGLKIFITELDVLDDGLPAESAPRDQAIADIYSRYLTTALEQTAIASVITFGLSDRYTWLQEDYPRDDGAPRRPLPFDDALQPKPAYDAIQTALMNAPIREPLWNVPLGS